MVDRQNLFTQLKNQYRQELLENVIPFWEKNCVDQKYGGFFTFLDQDGTVYNTDKFCWTQWRCVYMFAELYIAESIKDQRKKEWLEIAEKGFDFLVKHGKDETGNYYFGLNQEGEPIVSSYNIYSECFVLMGSATLFKATKQEKYKTEAVNAMNKYLSRLDNPKGKWSKTEGLKGVKKRHSLGHYMMLVNMGLVMKEYLNINDYDQNIDKSIDFVLEKFWNEKFQVIFENVNEDFSFDLDTCDGRHLNPGHGLEALWFIMAYAEKYNKMHLIDKILKMLKGIMKFSWDSKFGGIFYFMDVLNKPHIELQADMKLWWVHNEASIAALYGYYLKGDEECWALFEKIHDWSWKHFQDKKNGEWFGYLNRRGEVTHTLKGGKWKTFYHLPRCLLVISELFEKLEQRKNNQK